MQLLRSALVNNVTQAQIFKDIGIAQFVFKHDDLPMQPKECADYVEGNALVFQKSLGCDVVGHGSIYYEYHSVATCIACNSFL
mgnify:FL=1